ncbi:MAG: type II toxin-antitoxin system RelE/ParE family toxin [Leptospiraceae bacterium]|nr:type II toxin-antitoxin system RelE/ParE family toxin [Leptospiraceae bacterium]
MIKSFNDIETEEIFNGYSVKKFKAIEDIIRRKLRAIDSASQLKDLKSPPGNKLEALKNKGKSKNRDGQWSIRVNDKWRICFIWADDGVYEVEIVDYH